MRKNIQIVIAAFLRGEYANEKTCWTDGKAIYSYKMMIAKRSPVSGRVLVLVVRTFDHCEEHADCAAHASGAPDLGAECAARS